VPKRDSLKLQVGTLKNDIFHHNSQVETKCTELESQKQILETKNKRLRRIQIEKNFQVSELQYSLSQRDREFKNALYQLSVSNKALSEMSCKSEALERRLLLFGNQVQELLEGQEHNLKELASYKEESEVLYNILKTERRKHTINTQIVINLKCVVNKMDSFSYQKTSHRSSCTQPHSEHRSLGTWSESLHSLQSFHF
jgi:hypothetical protein